MVDLFDSLSTPILTWFAAHWTLVLTCNAIVSTIWGIWVTRSLRRISAHLDREHRLRLWAEAYEAEKKQREIH